jgi:hypothetical protein
MYPATINNSPTTRTVELQYLNSLNVVIKEHIILLHLQCVKNGNANKLKLQCSKLNVADSGGRAFKTLVCRPMTDGIAGSNPAESTDVRLFCLLCVV